MSDHGNNPVILVATVGTGGENNPVWEALAYSVKHHQPVQILWLCSRKTSDQTLPKVKQLITANGEKWQEEIFISKDPCHIENLYLEYISELDRLLEQFPEAQIIADFTSGTKAMSSALAVAAIARKVKGLAYMNGVRDETGRATRTTEAISFNPEQIDAEGRLREAIGFFNIGNFEAAGQIAETVRRGMKGINSDLAKKAKGLNSLANAYICWDVFQYKKALAILNNAVNEGNLSQSIHQHLDRNIKFIEICEEGYKQAEKDKGKWTDHRLVDMYQNARRRFEAGRYDDAVARCYRLMEYLAQRRLKLEYNLDTKCFPFENPRNDQAQSGAEKGKRIGMVEAYKELEKRGDDLGKDFAVEYVGKGTWEKPGGSLSNVLQSRNNSLLAHGFDPISRNNAQKILQVIEDWIKKQVKNFEKLKDDATFVRLPQFI